MLAQLAASADAFLLHPLLASLTTDCNPSLRPLPALCLPGPRYALDGLEGAPCSVDTGAALQEVYEEACRKAAEEARRTLVSALRKLRCTFRASAEQEEAELEEQVVAAWRRRYIEATESIRLRILDEVRSARARHARHASLPSTSPPQPPAPGTFTDDVLAVLNRAFAVSDSVSRAERRELAGVTGLNERQILTWFANQRQRRGKKQRASPYASHRRPTSTPSSHYQHLPPLRTVSGSSSASSLSLVSYAGESSEDVEVEYYDALPAPPAPPAREPDMAVSSEDDLALLPASAGASFASFAQQFQVAPVAYPPHLAEVPMMEFTSPTPIASSFSSVAPLPIPPPSFSHPSSSGGGFFSQTFAAPHAGSPSSSSLASSPLEAPTAGGMDDFDLESIFSSSTLESGYVPVAPAPTPSSLFGASSTGGGGGFDFAAGGGGVDAWMDAQFYENLLGSLGLSSSSAAEGDAAAPLVDGSGLTLSLEAVRADGGGEGSGFSFGGF